MLEQDESEQNVPSPDVSESSNKSNLPIEKSDLSALIETHEEKSDDSFISPIPSRTPSPIKIKEDKIKKAPPVKKNPTYFSPRKGPDWTNRLNKINPRGRGVVSYGSKPLPLKKKIFPHTYGESSTADMVLSANKVEIKDLQSQISFLQAQIKDVRIENKTLKTIQARQQKELRRIQEGKADIPSLLVSHKNEMKAVQTSLNAARNELKECQKDLRSRSDDVMRKEVQIRELNSALRAKDKVFEQKDETHTKSLSALNDKIKNLENDLEEKTMLYTQLKNQFYRVRIATKVLHNDCESPFKNVDSLLLRRTCVNVGTQTFISDFDSLSNPGSPELDCTESEELKVLTKKDSIENSDSSNSQRRDKMDDKARNSLTNQSPEVRRAKISSQAKGTPPAKKKVDFKSAPYSGRYETPKREPKISRPVKDSTAALPKFTPRSGNNFATEIFAKENERSDFKSLASFNSGLPNIGFNEAASTRYFNSVDTASSRVGRDMSKYDSLRSRYNLSTDVPIEPPSAVDTSAPRYGGW